MAPLGPRRNEVRHRHGASDAGSSSLAAVRTRTNTHRRSRAGNFSLGTLSGTDPALHFPQGDQAQAQAGAYYYYRDSWRLPLFAMAVPGIDGLRSGDLH
ncbi:hypothetical protein ACU4GD_14920 [Cupriavidus basilensis]